MNMIDLTLPRPKKNCRLPKPIPLPLISTEHGDIHKFTGLFNGFTVLLKNKDEMRKTVSMGFFGKANLSRSFPQFDGDMEKPEIIRRRQWQRRQKWLEKFKINNTKKVIMVPDSDEEEEYFKNLQVEYQIDRSGNREAVNLMLEEAFFMQNALKCLDIFHETKLLNHLETLDLFTESDNTFKFKYAVYYHFRSKNWVVKPGIKFGGDFLLYKEGPPFHHASYVVLIISDERNDTDTTALMGLHRMCETSGKELLLCQISWPIRVTLLEDLSNIKIKEILMKRWISSQERQEFI